MYLIDNKKHTKLSEGQLKHDIKMSTSGFQKCVICKNSGSEGYFGFPSNKNVQNQWLEKCPDGDQIKISPSKKVCFRHFQQHEIRATEKGYRLVPGKMIQNTVQMVIIHETK